MDIGRENLADIRLLALDLDGTLLKEDKRISLRTMNALQEAAELGIHIVPVTGRPYSGLPEDVMESRVIDYVITSNGAVTTRIQDGMIVRRNCMNDETAWEIARIPRERGLIHSVFAGGIGYCEHVFYQMQLDCFRGTVYEAYIRKSRRSTDSLKELIHSFRGSTENIWFITHDTQERDHLEQLIREKWDVRTSRTASRELEIGNPQADKGIAVRQLAEQFHLEKNQILAMGDSGNDLGLFAAAGISVAMGNATDAARKAATYITEDNESDGAAAVIEKIIAAKRK